MADLDVGMGLFLSNYSSLGAHMCLMGQTEFLNSINRLDMQCLVCTNWLCLDRRRNENVFSKWANRLMDSVWAIRLALCIPI